MIRQNEKINGIHINNQNIKLSQFADDTTLILDGTGSSLNNALSEICNRLYITESTCTIDLSPLIQQTNL